MDEFHKALLDNLQDGVYFTDQQRTFHYWNRGAERITGYTAAELIGRCCADNILAHVDDKGSVLCTTDCPLVEAMRSGTEVEKAVFLRHKRGHRVPVLVRVSPIRNEQGEIIGAVESFSDSSNRVQVVQELEELRKIAFVDALSGVANRRFAEVVIRARLEELRRYGWPLAAIFLDIDRFKQINDTFGHEHGDQVITTVARTLVANVRAFDFVARWGGDEFVVALTNTPADSLCALADKLRSLVHASSDPVSGCCVSVSAGATMALPSDNVRTLIKRADDLMYRSKAAGGNRVSLESA